MIIKNLFKLQIKKKKKAEKLMSVLLKKKKRKKPLSNYMLTSRTFFFFFQIIWSRKCEPSKHRDYYTPFDFTMRHHTHKARQLWFLWSFTLGIHFSHIDTLMLLWTHLWINWKKTPASNFCLRLHEFLFDKYCHSHH